MFLLSGRDGLNDELEKLRYEQRYMENDLSNIQIRWHTLREEKVKAANTLRDVKKAEEELERLAEEKIQVELDAKVICSSMIFYYITFFGYQNIGLQICDCNVIGVCFSFMVMLQGMYVLQGLVGSSNLGYTLLGLYMIV